MLKYDEAAAVLPEEIRAEALFLPDSEKASAEEFRLRCGRPPTVLLPQGEKPLSGYPVTQSMLEAAVAAASSSSRHSVGESVRAGFVTARGGHRVGVCGTAVVRGGEIESIRNFSSVSVRIARQLPGISETVLPELCGSSGEPLGTMILSPPGGGKTTFLRDLVRAFSSRGVRTGVIDERSEIAALSRGVPQFDVGPCTDVLELAPRAKAVEAMLRSMSPCVIALDEIFSEADAGAVQAAVGSGASVFATAHASSPGELRRRGTLRAVLESGAFSRLVIIRNESGKRSYEVEEIE